MNLLHVRDHFVSDRESEPQVCIAHTAMNSLQYLAQCLSFILFFCMLTVVEGADPTVGELMKNIVTYGQFVATAVQAGNIARISYVIFIYYVNNYIAKLPAVGM